LLVDQDDPEKRIAELERQLAELERQLAEARAAGDPGANQGLTTGSRLTPEQVRNVAFSKPPTGKRGYNEDEVDAFLDLVEEQMKSQQGVFPPPPQAGFPPPPAGPLPAGHTRSQSWFRRIIDAVAEIFWSGPGG
jgi:DivIVA domain-containing protein